MNLKLSKYACACRLTCAHGRKPKTSHFQACFHPFQAMDNPSAAGSKSVANIIFDGSDDEVSSPGDMFDEAAEMVDMELASMNSGSEHDSPRPPRYIFCMHMYKLL